MKRKKLKLWKLFYDLAFDNVISAEIEKFIETRGKDAPVPRIEELRVWAKKAAKKFG